jgi:hypothetical protein
MVSLAYPTAAHLSLALAYPTAAHLPLLLVVKRQPERITEGDQRSFHGVGFDLLDQWLFWNTNPIL